MDLHRTIPDFEFLRVRRVRCKQTEKCEGQVLLTGVSEGSIGNWESLLNCIRFGRP